MSSNFWRNKKVLVTGGAGFICSYVVEMLVREGARVTVPARDMQRTGFLQEVKKDIELVGADLKNADVCMRLCAGKVIVMYLAAEVGGVAYNIAHPAQLFQNNLLPFMQVIEASCKADVERFLVVSSACVYPRDAV